MGKEKKTNLTEAAEMLTEEVIPEEAEFDMEEEDETNLGEKMLEEAAKNASLEEVPEIKKDKRSVLKRRKLSENVVTKVREDDIITINKNNSPDKFRDEESERWHELQNSNIAKKVLTGVLSSIERQHISEEETMYVVVIDYYGIRVLIPLSEMNIILPEKEGEKLAIRQLKIASNMLGCEIDFTVAALDEKSKSVVGSRKDAMRRKVQDFYFSEDNTLPILYPGKVVEARIIAVAEKVLRLEIFGVECFATVFDINPAWMADAREKYSVGDTVFVRIANLELDSGTVSSITVEGKSVVLANHPQSEERVCAKNCRYFGVITGTNRKGVYFLRLNAGVNAIAHMNQAPGPNPKTKDEVAFVCTRMDTEMHVAVGIITRVIKRSKLNE